MKRILICFLFLTTFGFQACSDDDSASANECPEKPANSLTKKNIQEVTLNSQISKESGIARKNKSIGYTFDAKKGQKLTYNTDEDVCVWVYAPDNELLNSAVLPINGKYTIQVSSPKGSKTFELAMGLDVAESSSNISNNNTNSSNSNSSDSNSSSSITEQEAVNLIKRWQQAKVKIFAYPFDRNLGAEILTGEIYGRNISNYDSSMKWLKDNNSYYNYGRQEINSVKNFNSSGNQATIDVVTTEERTFCKNGRPVIGQNTVLDVSRVRYNFQFDQGKWKISGYDTLEQIQKTRNSNPSC